MIPSGRFAPGHAGPDERLPRRPTRPRAGRSTTTRRSSRATSRAARTSLRVDWQIASGTRLSARYIHNKDEDVQPLGTTTAAFNFPLAASSIVRKNGPGDVFSLTLTHTLQPDADQRVHLRRGPRRRLHRPREPGRREPRPRWASTRRSSSPAPIPQGVIPSVRFLGIANQTCPATGVANCATPVTDFNGTPFDQKFVDQQLHEQRDEGHAAAHRFKGGVYYQRANNQRTSFGPVQSNLVFGDSQPPEHRPPVRQRAPRHLRHLHPGRAEDHQQLLLPGHLRATSRTPGRSRRASRSTTGCASRTTSRSTTRRSGSAFFNPDLFDPARAVRLYRPVCVALPCTGANLRAIDPAVTARRRRSRTRGRRTTSATIVPGLRRPRSTASAAWPTAIRRAASRRRRVLWGPRLGFAWDATGDAQDGRARRLRRQLRPRRHRPHRGRDHQPARHPGVDAQQRQPADLWRAPRAATSCPSQGDVVGYRRDQKVPTVYSFSLGVQRDLGRGHRGRPRLRRHALAQQPAADRPQRDPLRGDVHARGPGPDALRRRGARRSSPTCRRSTATPASSSRGVERPQSQPAPALSGLRRDALPQLRQPRRLQLAAGGAAAAVLEELHLRPLLHAVARANRLRRAPPTPPIRSTWRPTTTRWPTSTAPTTSSPTTSGTCPRAAGLLGGGAFARALLDNWTRLRDLVDRVRQPHRADPLHRRRQRRAAPARHRRRRHVGRAAAAFPRGRRPRERRRHAQPGRLRRARARRLRALRPLLPAQPGHPQPRPVASSRTSRSAAAGGGCSSSGSRCSTSSTTASSRRST